MEAAVWPGWVGGIAIGIYGLLQFWLSNRQLGCSLAYGNFVGFLSAVAYFHREEFQQLNNWRLWFLLGIPLGGFIASISSTGLSEFHFTLSMGIEYEKIYPKSDVFKALIVTGGGVLMGVGARLAGGCTSGHVIVGCASFNPASLLAAALFFAGGLISVQLLFALLS